MEAFTGIKELDQALWRLSDAQSRDEADDAMGELAEVAPQHIEALEALYESNSYERMPLIWCLIPLPSENRRHSKLIAQFRYGYVTQYAALLLSTA